MNKEIVKNECRYCNDDHRLLIPSNRPGGLDLTVGKTLDTETLKEVPTLSLPWNPFHSVDVYFINYCPMCGRKLSEE